MGVLHKAIHPFIHLFNRHGGVSTFIHGMRSMNMYLYLYLIHKYVHVIVCELVLMIACEFVYCVYVVSHVRSCSPIHILEFITLIHSIFIACLHTAFLSHIIIHNNSLPAHIYIYICTFQLCVSLLICTHKHDTHLPKLID